MTEVIFDMSNVRICKEIEKKIMEMFILFYAFGHLSSIKRLLKEPMLLQNICSDLNSSWNEKT